VANAIFYIAAAIAILATAAVVTRKKAAEAVLYLVVSLLAIAVLFFLLGAPFIAALEVIVYAGAIMVLFIFFVMTLNLGARSAEQEAAWLVPRIWIGPAVLALLLGIELLYLFARGPGDALQRASGEPQELSMALFGPYMIAVEVASFLLLAGLVAAYHLGSGLVSGRAGDGRGTATGDKDAVAGGEVQAADASRFSMVAERSGRTAEEDR